MLTDDQSASTTRSDPSLLVCLKGFIVVECVVGLKPQGNISIPGGEYGPLLLGPPLFLGNHFCLQSFSQASSQHPDLFSRLAAFQVF